MQHWRFAQILGFMGQLRDRFSTYGENRTLAEKMALTAQVAGVKGVELVYPFDWLDVEESKRLLKQNNLVCSTVNVNLKAEAKFHLGSLTHRDPAIRREAVQYMKTGMDIAAAVGCNMITMCPLADGFDYAFQTDYTQAWRWLLDGVGEAAAHRAGVRVSLEYKQSETRSHVIFPDAGTALAACLQIGLANVGVTMDMGHALYAGESPAQSAALLAQAGRLFLVHVNDNYRNWDWDMIAGSVNPWDLVETLLYLTEISYSGWLTSDVAPFRLDAVKVCAATYRSLLWAERVIETIGRNRLWAMVRTGDPVDVIAALQEATAT